MNILPLNCFGNVQLVIANEKTTKRVVEFMIHATYLLHERRSSRYWILVKIWPKFSTRGSALPAPPVIEKSCSKPSGLPKF